MSVLGLGHSQATGNGQQVTEGSKVRQGLLRTLPYLTYLPYRLLGSDVGVRISAFAPGR